MGLNLRHFFGFVAIAGAVLALAGCERMSEVGFDTQMALGTVSMADRCSDFMRRAFPGGDIDILGSHVDADMDHTLITVQGVRTDLPAGSSDARNVAVECHFGNGVLTDFRWIAGPIAREARAPAR